jgi:hypothetical protein
MLNPVRTPTVTGGDGLARALAALSRHPDTLVATWAAGLCRGETASGKAPGTATESSCIRDCARVPAGP